jgi:predicted acyltransferase
MATTATNPEKLEPRAARPEPSGRLRSLDFFRGATIAAMILVNNPGNGPSSYWPLQHSRWNGWTPTDLVFPFFLFIVGVAMTFSFASRRRRGDSNARLIGHVLWRGVILFALGMFVNGFPDRYHLASWRIYGVLQRIALCYVIASLFALWTGRRTQIAAIVACLAGYWLMMRYLPVPGFGVPTHNVPLLDPDKNLVAWFDRKLLLGHLYEGTRDPEGLLSTIPAVASTLLGLLTGDWLRSARSAAVKLRGMILAGLAGVAAGEIFNLWFPINKKLWTSSYVLFTAGMALLCLAASYWLLDVKRKRALWAWPFLVLGMNAIAAYVLSEVVAAGSDALRLQLRSGIWLTWHDVAYERLFVPLGNPANASLLYALAFVFGCWVAMWLLYRKRIFLKV